MTISTRTVTALCSLICFTSSFIIASEKQAIVTGSGDDLKVVKVDLKNGYEHKGKTPARLAWNGGKLKITPGTKIRKLKDMNLELLSGKVITTVAKLEDQTFSIKSPTAVAGVRGTQFSVEVRDGEDVLMVLEGKVEFGDDKEKKVFQEKQRSRKTPKGWDVQKMTEEELQAELALIGDLLRRKSKDIMVIPEMVVGKGRANLIKGVEADNLAGHALESIASKLKKADVKISTAPPWVRDSDDLLQSTAKAYDRGDFGFAIQLKVILTPGKYIDSFSLYEMNAQATLIAIDGMTAEQMSIATKKGKGRGKSPADASEQALDKAISASIRPFSKLLVKSLSR